MEKKHVEFRSKATGYDEDRRLVWGWVSATDITDLQGDIIEIDEFKKMYDVAMDRYNEGKLTIDGNHSIKDVANIHETSKMMMADTVRWYVCVKVKDDAVWEAGKKDGFNGFSIGGWWERNYDEARKAFILKSIELDEFSLLFGKWESGNPIMPANQLGVVIGVKTMNERNLINQIWGRIQTAIENALKSLNEGDTMDEKKLKELVEGMIKSALDTFKEELAKAKKELAPEDLDVIQQMINDAISAAMSGEAMAEPAKAAKAATEKLAKVEETVKLLIESSEKQAKQIEELLKASATSQHNTPPAAPDKKQSAVDAYAEGLKSKEIK
jgi:hypothetical protein